MHKYLRAIGFSDNYGQREFHNFITRVIETPTARAYTTKSGNDDTMIAEFRMEIADGIGLSVCGTFDDSDMFLYEYCLPYVRSSIVSTHEEVTVERRIENDFYAGACDDLKVGVTIIFRLLNLVDYIKHDFGRGEVVQGVPLSLTALSLDGTIVFPIEKTEEQRSAMKKEADRRMNWMLRARDGDETAMRNLTMEDMDHYAALWNQIPYEDVFSLVDNYFMPTGMECDIYSVMGEIFDIRPHRNPWTGEELLRLSLDINDLLLDVCINRKDLYGEPAIGRRFKGPIWMQGTLLYPEN